MSYIYAEQHELHLCTAVMLPSEKNCIILCHCVRITYFGGEGSSLRLPILCVEFVELSIGEEPSDSVTLPDLLFFFIGCSVG